MSIPPLKMHSNLNMILLSFHFQKCMDIEDVNWHCGVCHSKVLMKDLFCKTITGTRKNS